MRQSVGDPPFIAVAGLFQAGRPLVDERGAATDLTDEQRAGQSLRIDG
ncbi:hypothetical protein RFN57_04505 [Streptomyces violaceochromogenes]|uniref:Uncharacterized protein n=1 Tax=Streptomyces violaceochromogenes TaxID=67377 RepID=A0ABU6LSC5_9ACTN|nr:hypothetical protein [Streptomyces violaceochromogenes]MEC7051547.1 hypothetical protein [Streptomyces violaceochromogenes]